MFQGSKTTFNLGRKTAERDVGIDTSSAMGAKGSECSR